MKSKSFELEKVIKEIEKIEKFHRTTRQVFKHLKKCDLGKSQTKGTLKFLTNRPNIILGFTRPIDDTTLDEMNNIAHFLNQNIVIRLYALMNYYGCLGEDKKIDRKIKGWEELDILRRLRNRFAHSSGRYNPQDTDDKKLFESVVSHFKLERNEYDSNEFPLPSTKVILEIFKGCKAYFREFKEKEQKSNNK